MTLNERISEWFEPRPKPRTDVHLGSSFGWIPSKLGYWRYGDREKPEPLDYLTDEAANARLLEAMPYPSLTRQFPSKEWMCTADEEADSAHWVEVYHQDRKTAIVLAFCKFAELSTEGRDGERLH